ncbi:hypothetical protein [Streptomyces tubercidicus]|uniref:hypothetical protein n=1 Tax=Streptomyces tubercidicus TaxID=47759 RepID=UPI003465E550
MTAPSTNVPQALADEIASIATPTDIQAKAHKLACDFDELQQRTPLSDGAHIAQRHILDVDPGTVIEIDGHLVPLPGVEHKASETA